MSRAPKHWVSVAGREVFELVTSGSRGWAKHYSATGAKFIRIGNLDHDSISIDLRNAQHVDPPAGAEGERTRLRPNDLLISITAELGMVGVVPQAMGEAYINQHIALARPKPELNAAFLAWYFASEADGKKALREMGRGGTKVGLGLDDIRDAEIPIAPLAEQQRIADKLDTVLARVDAVNVHLARVAPLLKRFRQSVLAAATLGRLTADWRSGQPSTSWRQAKIQDICGSIADGDHQAPPQVASGIPFITISAINRGRLDLSKATRSVPASYFAALAEKRRPRRGDVLYSVTGSIGIPALVETDEPFTFQRHVAILRPDLAQVSSSYLRHLLGCHQVKEQALKLATGTAQLTIPLGGLRTIEVHLPPCEEQAEIVRRVDLLFTFADRIEARLQAAQTATSRLTPSLLAKAFRGELVPQDPNDEPATELLRRLAQNKPETNPRSRKPSKPIREPKP